MILTTDLIAGDQLYSCSKIVSRTALLVLTFCSNSSLFASLNSQSSWLSLCTGVDASSGLMSILLLLTELLNCMCGNISLLSAIGGVIMDEMLWKLAPSPEVLGPRVSRGIIGGRFFGFLGRVTYPGLEICWMGG